MSNRSNCEENKRRRVTGKRKDDSGITPTENHDAGEASSKHPGEASVLGYATDDNDQEADGAMVESKVEGKSTKAMVIASPGRSSAK